jgi:hypothetical protein
VLASLVAFHLGPSSSSVHALSPGIFCRIILNSTQTVSLQHSHPIQGYPSASSWRWCGCLPSEWINANAVATEPIFAEYGIDNPSTGEHGAYVGFLAIRKIDKLFSGIDRVSRAPNRHVTWPVTCDLHTSVDHAANAFGWKYSSVVFA